MVSSPALPVTIGVPAAACAETGNAASAACAVLAPLACATSIAFGSRRSPSTMLMYPIWPGAAAEPTAVFAANSGPNGAAAKQTVLYDERAAR
jgi:hypothetical protein